MYSEIQKMKQTNKQQLTILFVEDEIEKDESLGEDRYGLDPIYAEMRDEGWEVEVPENGIEGYQKLKETSYDAILMDIDMPSGEGVLPEEFQNNLVKQRKFGLRLIELLKEDKSCFPMNTDKPIVVLTGLLDQYTWERLEALLTKTNCFGKPTLPEEIIARIYQLCQEGGNGDNR